IGFEMKAPESGDGRRETEAKTTDPQSVPARRDNPQFPLPVLAFRDVPRQSGFIAVEGAGDQEVEYTAKDLREVDPADLPTPLAYRPAERIVAAYHYSRLPYALRLAGQRRTPQEVLAAVCDKATITSVISREGLMRHRASYSLRSLGVQHLAVQLPAAASLWSVTLDIQPIEVRRAANTYLIPLPAGGGGSKGEAGRHEIELFYETQLAARGQAGGTSSQPQQGQKEQLGTSPDAALPPIRNPQSTIRNSFTIRQSAPQVSMTTLQLDWVVHLPDGAVLVSSNGDFKPLVEPRRPTLVGRLRETIARESVQELGWKFGWLAGVIATCGVMWLLVQSRQIGGLLTMLVAVGVIGVLIALLLPATQSARDAGRGTQCKNNLKQLALALDNYHDKYGQFPPATIGPNNVPPERQLSWIVAILPFIEEPELYKQFHLDEPWDSPHNSALARRPLAQLLCPAYSSEPTLASGYAETHYVAITGSGPDAASLPAGHKQRGILGYDRGLSVREIKDGTANTVMLVEVQDGGPWAAGGRATCRPIVGGMAASGFGSFHPGGINCAFGDGTVRFIEQNVNPETFRSLATAHGGDIVDSDDFGEPSVPVSGRKAKSAAGVPITAPGAAALPEMTPSDEQGEDKREMIQKLDQLQPESSAARAVPQPGRPAKMEAAPREQEGLVGAADYAVSKAGKGLVAERAADRGRLSLTLELDTHGWPGTVFTRQAGAGDLVLRLQDETFAVTLQWAVAAAIALVGWLLRQRSRTARAAWAAIWIGLPIGLSGLVPLAWTPALDGLFIGGLLALTIWCARTVAGRLVAAFPRLATAAAVGVLVFGATRSSLASQVSPQPPAVTSPQSAISDQSRRAGTISNPPSPLTLYVPYDPADGDPRKSNRVYLPYDEFLRLWNRAHPKQAIESPPAQSSLVADVEYEGRIDGELARFDGRLVVYTFRDEWVRVALPLGNVALERVELDGQPATLEERIEERGPKTESRRPKAEDREGEKGIYIEKAGTHVVDVHFSVPVTRLGATGRMTVPLRPASAGRLRLRLPEPGLDVQVEGAPGGWRRDKLDEGPGVKGEEREANHERRDTTDERREAKAGRPETNAKSRVADHSPLAPGAPGLRSTHHSPVEFITLPVGGAGEITLRWQPRLQRAAADQLVSVDQSLLIDIQESGIHLRGQFRYRVAQGSVRELRLRVPPGLAVRSVTGTDVADWSIRAEADADAKPNGEAEQPLTTHHSPLTPRLLIVTLKSDVRTATDVAIDTFLVGQEPQGVVAVRTPEPIGITRETGRMVVGCGAVFRVRVTDTSGLSQIEREGLPVPESRETLCSLLSAYRYTARPWSLGLVIERLQPRLTVAGHTALKVASRQLSLSSSLVAEIADASLASLKLRLPSGLRLSKVVVPPGAEWFVDRADGEQLSIELAEPVEGKVTVGVEGTLARDPAEPLLHVPMVSVEGAAAQRGQFAIYLDDDLDATGADTAGARSIEPAELTGPLDKSARTADPRYAFQYNTLPEGLSLRVVPAAPQVTADTATTVSVREGAVAYVSEIVFDIRRAGRERLRFTTPDWLGSDIELHGAAIRETTSQLDPSGRRVWEITLQKALRGTYRLHLTQVLPLPEDGKVVTPFIEPLDVERSRGYVILESRTTDELSESAVVAVTPLPPEQLPDSLGVTDELRQRAVSVHRVNGSAGQATLAWKLLRREQEKGLAASVNLADLITVVNRDGTYRTQAAYVVTNRTRQFLEFGLPKESTLWAVYVA
ncbi:MAG: DUF1559 domain-containing protein, partial [Planctomycetes bacterium]|nr:DUF1559 domain-containing protein [Planctomycetota bacterium]